MFGYVTLSANNASPEEKKTYRRFYCGLCHVLGQRYGRTGTHTLSYDMVFLAILLSDLEDAEKTEGKERCLVHPMKNHSYVTTPVMDYAADMQLLLSYYATLDDIKDEGKDRKSLERFREILPCLEEKYPRQCQTAKVKLEAIGRLEKEGKKNPEYAAVLFGELLGEIFCYDENSFFASDLWSLGCGLGRFIYLLDAFDDRKSDRKKGLYNPLPDEMTEDEVKEMLLDAASSASLAFERLALDEYVPILSNILYSGIWSKFKVEKKK